MGTNLGAVVQDTAYDAADGQRGQSVIVRNCFSVCIRQDIRQICVGLVPAGVGLIVEGSLGKI